MTTNVMDVSDEKAIEALRANLRGQMILVDEADYHEARKVFNGMIDRHPALIVRPVGAADVVAAVNFVRDHAILVSVKGGAHNVPGNAVCDGGLVIDFSRMRGIRVDPAGRTARAEPGLKWGEFDRETHAFGLATTGGTFSDTGIAGLTLGGGIGWLGGKYGLASDNLLSADIVTADGQLLKASEGENADLFWALRGGGGNFGIVTSFEYRLHPVTHVLAGPVFHPFERAREVLKFYREFSTGIPDELVTLCGFLTQPDGTPAVGIAVCYNGPTDEGENVIRPLREFGPPMVDQIGVIPYTALQTAFDPLAPTGRHYYEKAPFFNQIPDEVIDALVDGFAQVPSPFTLVIFQQKPGEMARGPSDRTAFGHRLAPYNLVFFAAWEDPSEAELNISWARQLAARVETYSDGGEYVNSLSLESVEGTDRIKAAFGPNYERLLAVKRKYDPTNVFRHNQNIRPMV